MCGSAPLCKPCVSCLTAVPAGGGGGGNSPPARRDTGCAALSWRRLSRRIRSARGHGSVGVPPTECSGVRAAKVRPPWAATAGGCTCSRSTSASAFSARNRRCRSIFCTPESPRGWARSDFARDTHVTVSQGGRRAGAACALPVCRNVCLSTRAGATQLLAIGETFILLHPPLPLVGVSIAMERERQQNDILANG